MGSSNDLERRLRPAVALPALSTALTPAAMLRLTGGLLNKLPSPPADPLPADPLIVGMLICTFGGFTLLIVTLPEMSGLVPPGMSWKKGLADVVVVGAVDVVVGVVVGVVGVGVVVVVGVGVVVGAGVVVGGAAEHAGVPAATTVQVGWT